VWTRSGVEGFVMQLAGMFAIVPSRSRELCVWRLIPDFRTRMN